MIDYKGNNISEIDKINTNEFNNFYEIKKKYSKNSYFLLMFKVLLIIFTLLNIIIILRMEKQKLINKFMEIIQNNNNHLKKIYQNISNDNNFLKQYINNNNKKIQLIEKAQNLQQVKIDLLSYSIKNICNFDIINIFRPMDVIGKQKIRIGRKNDGGYIMLNDFKDIKIAYSFGISREISFDKGLADRNIDVYMYDHSISGLPIENKKFHWKRIGLSSKNTTNSNMKTLKALLIENGHLKQQNMILKIDIESSEWNVFQELPSNIIKQFKFIVGEFHFSPKNKIKYLNLLKKIQMTHQIIHLHCNNCGGGIFDYFGYNICSLLEITFVQKKDYQFSKFNSSFPIEGIDYKNCNNKKDINYLLNSFV